MPYLDIFLDDIVQQCDRTVFALDVLEFADDIQTEAICLSAGPVTAVHVVAQRQD